MVSDSLRPHGLNSPWNSPSQNTGVNGLSLLQGIFPTQGSNPGLQHHRQILYQLSHKGSPRILEWVAYPFSRGSSWLRNPIRVSWISGGFFTTELWWKPFSIKETWTLSWVSLCVCVMLVLHLFHLLAFQIKSLFLTSTSRSSIYWPVVKQAVQAVTQ